MLPLEIYPTHSPDPTEDSLEGCFMLCQRDEDPAGEFKVYWMDADIDDNGNGIFPGWYWVARPDDEHEGPFLTSRDAFVNAQEACQ